MRGAMASLLAVVDDDLFAAFAGDLTIRVFVKPRRDAQRVERPRSTSSTSPDTPPPASA